MKSIIIRSSGGSNIVIRPMSTPQWQPPATTEAALVEVWSCEVGKSLSEAVKIGEYRPGDSLSIPVTSETDSSHRIFTRSKSASGVYDTIRLEDGERLVAIVQRETEAPTIGLASDATADSVIIGVKGFTEYARQRRLRVAESLIDGQLASPSVQIFDAGSTELAKEIIINRTGSLTPDFTWAGGDPEDAGFTKTGAALTEANPEGWRINSGGSDAATYYLRVGEFDAAIFDSGFTLEVDPPIVTAPDSPAPSSAALLAIDKGSHYRHELKFSSTEVSLNGELARAHDGQKVRVVVASGGASADLWIGDTLVAEDIVAASSTVELGLSFGDLTGADDADVVWKAMSYALSAVPVRLPQTIYVSVAHSSGIGWSAESEILEVTFAADLSGVGGTTGDFNPEPIHEYTYEPGFI